MDYNDISKWLREDLNLSIRESQLNSLIYHPRHGTCMRNLIVFLLKSTLCSDKYPTVHVREEREENEQKRDFLMTKIQDSWIQLEETVREEQIYEMELCNLKSQLQLLQETTKLQENALEALKTKAPPLIQSIERARKSFSNSSYLKTTIPLEAGSSSLRMPLTSSHSNIIYEKLCNLTKKADVLQRSALEAFHLIEEESLEHNKNQILS